MSKRVPRPRSHRADARTRRRRKRYDSLLDSTAGDWDTTGTEACNQRELEIEKEELRELRRKWRGSS